MESFEELFNSNLYIRKYLDGITAAHDEEMQ